MSTGFLPPKYSVFDLNPEQAAKGLSLDQKAAELLEERYHLLTQLRSTQRSRMSSYGRTMGAFEDFSETGKKLLTDSRWPAVFKTTDEDKARYGDTNSTLGIDWGKQINNTPSKRTYRCIDPLSAEIIPVDELSPLFA